MRAIIGRIEQLASGRGYLHPTANVYFRRNQPLTFSEDLTALVHAQTAWFQLHGRDKSRGWAMRHPIAKLLVYQRYVACGGNYELLLRGAAC